MSRLWTFALLFLFASGVFLYAFPSATIHYVAIDLSHVAVGILFAFAFVTLFRRWLQEYLFAGKLAYSLTVLGAVAGIVLIFTGGSRPSAKIFYTHALVSVAGCTFFLFAWLGKHSALKSAFVRAVAALVSIASIAGASWWIREVRWQNAYAIHNPEMPPDSMDGEGQGPQGPFFPSSARTADGQLIPSKFFLESKTCERCHADIYKQWNSSAHHFSSFNNQWYRKSIEYMQDVNGVKSSKWCAGCHDPALLYTGKFETPIKDRINTPEAQAGLACVMCHSITKVHSTMGQGDFDIEYPGLHDLAISDNVILRSLHDFAVKLNPEPHRRTFLKPFHREQTAIFCSSCHKVHLDVPVNNYRWIRGFNDYDNWQASGVSGQGARSFYYPAKSQKCADCHMPLVDSKDFGQADGKVHSHRFAAANTAIAVANQDHEQFAAVESFLKDNNLSIDIFALSAAPPKLGGGEAVAGEAMSTFAVGEEAEQAAKASGDDATPVTAPLNRVNAQVRRGDDLRVDVVVRTKKVGHFFPGGTVDAFDAWVELKATDNNGRVIFWSGQIEDEGKGPVEKGAHFYRSLLLDANGNVINKRNAWAARALVYVRLIPPGAADAIHYRLHVPEDAGDEIHLEAKLNYRKFMWWNTQFAFAGERDPAVTADVTPHYDNGPWKFTGDTSKVSAVAKQIPNLPVVTITQDRVTLRVVAKNTAAPQPKASLVAEDWQRWNDYGIGLLLQGDLRAAEAAFRKVTEIDAKNPDGWVNIGRVLVQEGSLESARNVLDKAIELQPNLARAHFFYGRALKMEGRYVEALGHQRQVLEQYPYDRVARNEAGRILFLQKKYREAIAEFQQTLAVDPEDLQAHYNLMLCYTGLGENARAEEHRKRYLRFKADESAQAITGPYRQAHPEDNNERQAIHEHVSVDFRKSTASIPTRASALRPSNRRQTKVVVAAAERPSESPR
ncbi:MAG: tetratricopeptide repeat protein [Acidobacteria bacterium]|nr:tetratricopeptide repeat protein [Acidobacteriota bacterium]